MSEKRVTLRQKQIIAERANYCCEYCLTQSDYGVDPFAVEHIQPIAGGGKTALDNLALACQSCNNHKFTKTVALDSGTDTIVPLYNPRQDRWDDHSEWSADFLTIIGLTPTGRATIELLRVNRTEVVNLRRVLRLVGEHPPSTVKRDR